jgi:hypothetical protein
MLHSLPFADQLRPGDRQAIRAGFGATTGLGVILPCQYPQPFDRFLL